MVIYPLTTGSAPASMTMTDEIWRLPGFYPRLWLWTTDSQRVLNKLKGWHGMELGYWTLYIYILHLCIWIYVVYIYIHTYIYINTYIYIYIYVCMYIHIYVYTHICIYYTVYVYTIYMYVYIHMYLVYLYVLTLTSTCMRCRLSQWKQVCIISIESLTRLAIGGLSTSSLWDSQNPSQRLMLPNGGVFTAKGLATPRTGTACSFCGYISVHVYAHTCLYLCMYVCMYIYC